MLLGLQRTHACDKPRFNLVKKLIEPSNLYANLPQRQAEESFEMILKRPQVRIERIVSRGHASPEDFWYDQEWDEWVALLKGRAALVFETRDQPVELGPGDHLLIPAHARHRVAWTDAKEETIWLAVHLAGGIGKNGPSDR